MKTLYFKLALCFFLLLAGNATQGIWAQQEPIQIAGIVLDEHGDPLPGYMTARWKRFIVIYGVIIAGVVFGFLKVPTAFMPDEADCFIYGI